MDFKERVPKVNNRLNAENEDLNLVTNNFILDIPKDVIFPSELTEFLKEKVEYLMHENGMLKKTIAEYDGDRKVFEEKIQSLESKLSKYQDTSEFAPVANVARQKIVELSKKLREKNSELETFRNKYLKLEQEVQSKTDEVKEKNDNIKTKVISESDSTNQLIEEIANLKEKYVGINNKLFEAKNANLLLKNDLKVANKLLQEEIGESFEKLQQIRGGNWKGRAQIIADLQHKNLELKDKLKYFQEKVGKDIDTNPKNRIFERKLEKINQEYEVLKVENHDLKKKFDSLKLRYKNLDIECSSHKNKFLVLTNEIEKERDLLSQLSLQNSQNVSFHNEQLKKKDSVIDDLKSELKKSSLELMQEKCKFERLEKEASEKSDEIKELHKVISTKGFNSKPNDPKVVKLLEEDKLHITELAANANQRLINERDAKASIENLLRQEKQKVVKLESKITHLQLQESLNKSNSYSSISSKNASKDELLEDKLILAEENVKALQTRLEIEKHEREQDFQDFIRIFKNHNCVESNCASSNSIN